MHIDYWNQRGSFSITKLLTFDITFVFYDGIAIDRCWWRVHNVDTRRRLRMWRDVKSKSSIEDQDQISW